MREKNTYSGVSNVVVKNSLVYFIVNCACNFLNNGNSTVIDYAGLQSSYDLIFTTVYCDNTGVGVN